jgi:RNA recognition motif-containing protein
MKIFVGGISGDFDDLDLKEMFELYGEVKSAQVIRDRATGKSKGFGFVEMPNATEAQETITLLDGVGLYGKKIAVKPADDQPRPGGSSPRPASGGYNSNRGSGGFNNGNRSGGSSSGGSWGNRSGGSSDRGGNSDRGGDDRGPRRY